MDNSPCNDGKELMGCISVIPGGALDVRFGFGRTFAVAINDVGESSL